jgi:hypothetical protein
MGYPQQTRGRQTGPSAGGKAATEKQVNLLKKYRKYRPGMTFDDASAAIDQIAQENNWSDRKDNGGGQQSRRPAPQRRPAPSTGPARPCSPRQAAVLKKFGYDTNCSAKEASEIMDELAANDWQPLDGGPEPAPEYDADYSHDGDGGDWPAFGR